MALPALCPFLLLAEAPQLFAPQLQAALGTDRFGLQLAAGLANAGYAFGAVAAADLTRRFPTWRVFLACEVAFVVGSALAVGAPDVAVFTAGRLVQGAAIGMLLVAELPPLVTAHGVAKPPSTAAFVNLGLFGAATGFAVGRAGFDRQPARDRGMGFDVSAVPVAAGATVLPFVAVSLLTNRQAGAAAFLCPLLLGGIALGTLVIRQYHKREALMPVQLISHTLPVTGIGLACAAGAGFTALVQLATSYLLEVRHTAPGVVGGVLLTQVVGVAIAAVLVKRLFSTLWLPVPAFGGMSAVVAAGLVLLRLGHGGALPTVAVAGLLLGFGAGAGVSPGLFLAGLSVAANKLGPTFALVELLRAEAAFLVGPVVLNAVGTGAALREGVHEGALIVMVGGAVVSLVMLLVMSAARAQPQAPDLESWLAGERPAYRSPAFAAALREV